MNNKVRNFVDELKDELWLEFHKGNINDDDEFYTYVHESIDNAVIYNYDNEEYLQGNSEYYFLDHDVYGRPDNIAQAAYALLYDAFTDEDGWNLWSEMEEVLNEQ